MKSPFFFNSERVVHYCTRFMLTTIISVGYVFTSTPSIGACDDAEGKAQPTYRRICGRERRHERRERRSREVGESSEHSTCQGERSEATGSCPSCSYDSRLRALERRAAENDALPCYRLPSMPRWARESAHE